MTKHEIVIIGNIAMEQNTDCYDNYVVIEGGACLYASYVAASLQKDYALVTKLSKHDEKMLKKVWGISGCLYSKFNGRTAAFENNMPNSDREAVEKVCLQKGAPFQIDDIPEVDTFLYYFAGDVYGDFPLDTIKYYATKGMIAVDMQAFMNHVDPTSGRITIKDYKHKKELLPYCDFVKANGFEAEILTGTTDMKEACDIIKSWGANEVMITKGNEVYVLDEEDNFYKENLYSKVRAGRIGRGTTIFTTYILGRLFGGTQNSLSYAAAMGSIKLGTLGPVITSIPDVIRQMELYHLYED